MHRGRAGTPHHARTSVMSRLFLVRHAQASFGGADYDRLSSVGEEQARRLGIYWAQRRMAFDGVFIGPRRRHSRTAEIIGAILSASGLPWPEPVVLPEADEYAGLEVFHHALPRLPSQDLALLKRIETTIRAGAEPKPSAELLGLFQRVIGKWVRGEVEVPGVESWQEFRARARRGLETMIAAGGDGRQLVVFTSTGPVAAAMDLAFDLDDERLMEVSWQVRNTAVSEFLFSMPRFSLSVFNTLPHLSEDELITRI